MERFFVVQQDRFCVGKPDIYILQGYFQGNTIAGNRLKAFLDGQELPLAADVREGLKIRQKFQNMGLRDGYIDREYDIKITLPDNLWDYRRLTVFQYRSEERKRVFSTTVSRLLKKRGEPESYLESFREEGGRMFLGGWAAEGSACTFTVLGADSSRIPADVRWLYREDVLLNFPEIADALPKDDPGPSLGFELSFAKPAYGAVRLLVAAGNRKKIYRVGAGKKTVSGRGGQPSMLEKAAAYFHRNGLKRTAARCVQKLFKKEGNVSYQNWRKSRIPTEAELTKQRETLFSSQPLISVAVPLFQTPLPYLEALVASVEAQTYANWELCLSDGSGADSPLFEYLQKLAKKEPRIKVAASETPLGIAQNTNAALEMAQGDFIAFADHDDLLAPDALFECVRTVIERPQADLIYTDEDKVTMNGREYFQPHFKPDFNIDLLRSMNYICHLLVVKRTLLEAAGPLDPAYDGAQDYDLALRCAEKAKEICHIPKALYHWRAHKASTAENPESKRYAFEAGQRAIEAHLARLGIKAKVAPGEYPGLYRVTYAIPDDQPLVSVIIPNKDHTEDLDKCLRSILEKSAYRNLEFVIVENNSTQPETFAYYERIQKERPNVRVIEWEGAFNYSGINNFGAKHANGDYLLLLNNDTEMINEDALEELLGPCLRQDVGIVGARLYYPDDTIQHAGVIVGFGGVAGHAFIGSRRGDNGYFSRIICQADLSAVTAACMMVKRSVFETVGGLDETFVVAFNDIDFCLRVRELGKLVVYNPFAEFYHYESKSRGLEDTPQKVARFNEESNRLTKRWETLLKQGDPYYNPNLTLNKADFSLRED